MHIARPIQLSRRTVLRGLGATMALPFLESMMPLRTIAGSTNGIPARMAVFYFGTGMNMRQFEPTEEGPNFALPPILKPLENYRDNMTIFSGTYLEHGGGHNGDYTFLTGANAKRDGGIYNTISADQVVANAVGQSTRFPSLQLSVKRGTGYGSNLRTLSWNDKGVPLASESDPHVIFERLFQKDSPDMQEQRARGYQRRGSILDAVQGEAKRLERKVSKADKEKLDEYYSSVREVEKQLERNKQWMDKPKPQVDTKGLSSDFSESYSPEETRNFKYQQYSDMMYDLITLAFQTDSTRVISYVVRQELSGGVYPEFGVSKGYHSLSHHNNDPKNLEELAKVDTIYMQFWTHLLDRMQAVKEVDGSSLLDHTMLAYSSGMGIGHSKTRLPTALFGGKALGIQHQGHLRLPDQTPLSALWQTMADRMGVETGGEFQDSPGLLKPIIA